MEEKKLIISPKELYPTESLESIKNENLKTYVERYRNDEKIEKPTVFSFYGNYYILYGHDKVLAAIIAGEGTIEAKEVDINGLSFWKEEANVKDTLKSLGKSTLHDFETIGNFTYNSYPCFYEKGC